jgi:exopolyphosphatase/guanosine-5'-triphosphate,3'-diphosphate pyrophosphatase
LRIAAIDVGSNSIHLVVVETDAMGGQRVLAREKAMVRLARGAAKTGRIAPEAFGAGLEALASMARTVEDLACDTVMACGTAALRDAANAGDFVAEAARLGIPIQVISGEEEARLIHQAVSHAIPFPEVPVALTDIGGGSTELTWVLGGRVLASTSLPWGLQRLADAVPTANPPVPDDLRKLKRFIAKILRKARKALPRDLPAASLVLGTSGTLEDLARGAGGNGGFSRAQLEPFRRRLWHADAQARVEKLGVDPKRAEVLHVGATWAASLLKWLGAPEVRCVPVGLREGMVWEALKHGGVAIPPLADRRRASVESLAARLDPDPGHSLHVQALCDQLFDGLMPHFELGDTEREWLAAAARLHDIGFSLSEKGHHKHGAYLIRAANLPGFWPEEVEILAQIVRHHRGSAPKPAKHEAFRQLAPWHQRTVAKLTAILRTADALDRRRRQAVQSVRIEEHGEALRVVAVARGPLGPETAAFEEKARLLVRLLDRPLALVQG